MKLEIVLNLLLILVINILTMSCIKLRQLKEENKELKERAVAENAAVFKVDEKTQKMKLVWASDLFEEFGVYE